MVVLEQKLAFRKQVTKRRNCRITHGGNRNPTIMHFTRTIQHDWPVDNNVVTTVVTIVTLINYSFNHNKNSIL